MKHLEFSAKTVYGKMKFYPVNEEATRFTVFASEVAKGSKKCFSAKEMMKLARALYLIDQEFVVTKGESVLTTPQAMLLIKENEDK